MTKALCILQALGISHGDISLKNVVYKCGHPKKIKGNFLLIDFGGALKIAPFSTEGMIVPNRPGTEEYLAPENKTKHRFFNPYKSDLWSVAFLINKTFKLNMNKIGSVNVKEYSDMSDDYILSLTNEILTKRDWTTRSDPINFYENNI